MQPFTCPQCGHQSSFDPWVEAAACPQCGFSPPTNGPRDSYIRWASRYTYQPYLEELASHWNGTHTPEPTFTIGTPEDAREFFRRYLRTLGLEAPNYDPTSQELLTFVDAYTHLQRGDRSRAADALGALTVTSPLFVEPWIWLTATTDDVAARQSYLEKATRLDSAHALARDALSMARGRISISDGRREEGAVAAACPVCGAPLPSEPAGADGACPQCGHQVPSWEQSPVEGQTPPSLTPQLTRRYEARPWAEAQHLMDCQACGARAVVPQHPTTTCALCGSDDLLVEEDEPALEQPDEHLPFSIGEQEAEDTARRAQKSLLRRLKAWWTREKWSVVDVRGVYLPFWLFDGVVETYRTVTDTGSPRKESLMWDVHRDLPVSGVKYPSPSALARVYPYELEDLVPYDPGLLENWPVCLPSQSVELAAGEARQTMLARTRRQSSPIPSVKRRHLLYQVLDMTYRLALFPVWLVLLESQLQRRVALVNGQTGRITLGSTIGVSQIEEKAPEEGFDGTNESREL